MESTAGGGAGGRWGFIGSGQMATALVRGMLGAQAARVEDLAASDAYESARAAFHKNTGVVACDSNAEVVRRSDALVLAVMPVPLVPVMWPELVTLAKPSAAEIPRTPVMVALAL